ncbi:MAG: DUF6519 domain-containing protein [Candidatus Solibacter sp.]
MPSDRDRLSFDANQKYRSVVAQQGRVTVPADFNEAQEIAGEEQRSEALDFVGPVGTPDDGYAIGFTNPSANFDFNIGPGTMYVGGERVTLPPGVTYFQQPDWLTPTAAKGPKREYIFLRLEEREISAQEDSALREVALGGPDTTQRTRLMQRVVRVDTTGADCAAALAAQIKIWAAEGWDFDPNTMRLNSQARLQVAFDTTGPPPGPCEPAASGGYLGAENQLIRVRISAEGKFVWGFDNASFLYRADVVDTDTIKLQTPPVDQYHFPRKNQVVELLRADAKMANGEFIATAQGLVMKLGTDYNPDAMTLDLPSAIPTGFVPPDGTPRLFVRVWEDELTYTSGTPVALGNTGLTVTITSPAALHTGDFWVFAARPSTPVELYQNRYTVAPQPPEGPRVWVCPLAVISWVETTGELVTDCREQFDNLVELTKRKGGGCCTVTLKPDDLEKVSFNDIIAKLPPKIPAKICLTPGIYVLRDPILITRDDLTIESCPDGAILRGRTTAAFRFGMISISGANVALHGLALEPAEARMGRLLGLTAAQMDALKGPKFGETGVCIGVHLINSTRTAIEKCRITLPSTLRQASLFAVAVHASGAIDGLVLRGNTFDVPPERDRSDVMFDLTDADFRAYVGYLHTSQVAVANPAPAPAGRTVKGELLAASLQNATIVSNNFGGMTAAALVFADIGAVRATSNDVRRSFSGLWFLTLHSMPFFDRLIQRKEILVDQAGVFGLLSDPVIQFVSTLGRSLELEDLKGITFEVAVPPTQPFPNLPPGDTSQRMFFLWSLLVPIEQKVFTDRGGLRSEIQVSHNRVEVFAVKLRVVTTGSVGSHALVMWGEEATLQVDRQLTSCAMTDSNELRAQIQRDAAIQSEGAVIIIFFAAITVTGNVILNQGQMGGKRGLIAFPALANVTGAAAIAPIAITGNIVQGDLRAPNRAFAAPLNDWASLNTVIPF